MKIGYARVSSLPPALGFTLHDTAQCLRAYAQFVANRGDTLVQATIAVKWASAAPSPDARHVRLRDVVKLARFLHAEDLAHEVPVLAMLPGRSVRPIPYIYTVDEIARIVAAAGKLRATHPLRRSGYATLLGLIASTWTLAARQARRHRLPRTRPPNR